MSGLDLLLTRGSARKLADPAPTADQLDTILRAAVAAPDHGRLRPWRFVVISGEARARFGRLMAESLRRAQPDASPEALEREERKPFRAPTIVAVAAHIVESGKVPALEQITATAAATQNMMLAADALGLGAMWKTGAPAYEEDVKTGLGFAPDDEIVGFIYLGARPPEDTSLPRADIEGHVSILPV
jgi:nitroreductase